MVAVSDGSAVSGSTNPQRIGCHLRVRGGALPTVFGPLDHWIPSPHLVIGNFYLDWNQFRQHMLASTLIYFLVFLALSQLRQLWNQKSEPIFPTT
jgi:hypothetical protein